MLQQKPCARKHGNSWGEGGSSKTPLEWKFLRGEGGANQKPSVGGVWIFSGTTHSVKNLIRFYEPEEDVVKVDTFSSLN